VLDKSCLTGSEFPSKLLQYKSGGERAASCADHFIVKSIL
jgi:hypothetical protein